MVEQEDALRRQRRVRGGIAAAVIAVVAATGFGYYRLNHGAHVSSSAGNVDARSLAVLYLADERPDSSLHAVASGLTESLISQLAQVEGLRVVSPGGVAPYRGTDVADDSVARALKVGVLVKGGIEQQGTAYRVSLKLVDQGGGDIDRKSFRIQ